MVLTRLGSSTTPLRGVSLPVNIDDDIEVIGTRRRSSVRRRSATPYAERSRSNSATRNKAGLTVASRSKTNVQVSKRGVGNHTHRVPPKMTLSEAVDIINDPLRTKRFISPDGSITAKLTLKSQRDALNNLRSGYLHGSEYDHKHDSDFEEELDYGRRISRKNRRASNERYYDSDVDEEIDEAEGDIEVYNPPQTKRKNNRSTKKTARNRSKSRSRSRSRSVRSRSTSRTRSTRRNLKAYEEEELPSPTQTRREGKTTRRSQSRSRTHSRSRSKSATRRGRSRSPSVSRHNSRTKHLSTGNRSGSNSRSRTRKLSRNSSRTYKLESQVPPISSYRNKRVSSLSSDDYVQQLREIDQGPRKHFAANEYNRLSDPSTYSEITRSRSRSPRHSRHRRETSISRSRSRSHRGSDRRSGSRSLSRSRSRSRSRPTVRSRPSSPKYHGKQTSVYHYYDRERAPEHYDTHLTTKRTRHSKDDNCVIHSENSQQLQNLDNTRDSQVLTSMSNEASVLHVITLFSLIFTVIYKGSYFSEIISKRYQGYNLVSKIWYGLKDYYLFDAGGSYKNVTSKYFANSQALLTLFAAIYVFFRTYQLIIFGSVRNEESSRGRRRTWVSPIRDFALILASGVTLLFLIATYISNVSVTLSLYHYLNYRLSKFIDRRLASIGSVPEIMSQSLNRRIHLVACFLYSLVAIASGIFTLIAYRAASAQNLFKTLWMDSTENIVSSGMLWNCIFCALMIGFRFSTAFRTENIRDSLIHGKYNIFRGLSSFESNSPFNMPFVLAMSAFSFFTSLAFPISLLAAYKEYKVYQELTHTTPKSNSLSNERLLNGLHWKDTMRRQIGLI